MLPVFDPGALQRLWILHWDTPVGYSFLVPKIPLGTRIQSSVLLLNLLEPQRDPKRL